MVGNPGDDAVVEERRRSRYLRELHVTFTAVLAIMLAAALAIGWSYRPQSTGPRVTISKIELSASGTFDQMWETMDQRGAGTMLELSDSGLKGPWIVAVFPGVDAFGRLYSDWKVGWRVCTARRSNASDLQGETFTSSPYVAPRQGSASSLPGISSTGNLHIPIVYFAGHGPLLVQLCWDEGGPEAVSGGYISADFPRVAVPVATATANRFAAALHINQPDSTYHYSVQSSPPPAGEDPQNLIWDEISSSTPADRGFHVAADDLSSQQQENNRSFESGIAFGIAGAIAVAFLQELFQPLRRRREDV